MSSPGIHFKSGARPQRSPPRNSGGEIICTHQDCKDDQLTFKRLCEYNKHMDKHERPYKCGNQACRKNPGFTYAGGLLRHQREVHGMHRTKDPFFCPHSNCNRNSGSGFSRKENLEEHLRRRHPGVGVEADSITCSTTNGNSSKNVMRNVMSSTATTGTISKSDSSPTVRRLEPLPPNRKRCLELSPLADDQEDGLDRTISVSNSISALEVQFKSQLAYLQRENEKLRRDLIQSEQRCTDRYAEIKRLRGMLGMPAISVPSIYHQPHGPPVT